MPTGLLYLSIMSAQTITSEPQLGNVNAPTKNRPPTRNVAAVFADEARAKWALMCLIREGFPQAQLQQKQLPQTSGPAHLIVVRDTQRAIAALEILVNAGGDTHVDQTEQLADQAA